LKRLLSIAILIAVLTASADSYGQYANIEFIENKGQWDASVRFKGVINNGAIFLREKGFRVLQTKPEDAEKLHDILHGVATEETKKGTAARAVVAPVKSANPITVHSHAYDVTFENAATPVVSGDKPLKTYNNYFIGNDPSKWQSDCRIFQAITYQNIYPGIDVRYYTTEGHLKYDLIVQPGADVSKIVMKYDGIDGLEVRNEQLIVKTSVGEMKELAPYAFQVIDGLKKEIACRFKVDGKSVRFAIANYSGSSPLIIDPSLIFSTFTGSTADNWGYTATYGPDGSFYAGGIVFNQGFPTSPGAFQATFTTSASDEEGLPGYDIGIMKFSPTGADRLYATYIGGSGNEQPHSLVVDPQGNLVIAGRTNSTNYPTNRTTYGSGGGYDIVLTKLNALGSTLLGSRLFGGKERDGVNIRPKYAPPTGVETIRRNYGDDARSEVILDNAGNIVLASNTQSSDFQTTSGALQRTYGGKQDGVIIKTSPDLNNVLFSTFLGGSEVDAAFVLALNPNDNNIYVGGNTVSTDMPGSKAGSIYPTFNGATDGFVSIISNNGSSLIKTTYIGTSGNDMLYGIQFDKFGYPYIMGTTTSGTWPIVNAAYSQAGGKQFIAKLKPDLSAYEYSTAFGGTTSLTPNISPIAFLVDRCENVYVSGWGGQTNTRAGYPSAGTSGLPVTPDAIQRSTDNSDFYFFVLERNATRQLYGSFYGQNGGFGEHVDGGTSRFDKNGVIYQALCANCGRDVSFPTTPGVWSPNNGSPECNLAAVKIAFNLSGVASSIRASILGVTNDTTGCVPLTVDFRDTIGLGKKYIWNFGDGSPEETTTTPNLSHTFAAVGDYRVSLTSIDSSKCNISDVAFTTIRVRSDKAILDFVPRKLEPCDAFNYEFSNISYVSPEGKSFTPTSFTWDFGDKTPVVAAGTEIQRHTYPAPGVYNVTLELTDTSFCNAPVKLTKQLRISTNVNADFQTPKRGCAPYNAVFENTSAGGQQFFWDFGDGTTSTDITPVHLYPTPGTFTIRLRAVDSATCNFEDTTSFTIIVSSQPVASFTYSPVPPQENTPVDFVNTSTGASNFRWEFGDGEILQVASAQNVQHTYNETKKYNACLIALNAVGCPDTVCQSLQAKVLPLLDVPNAFTPNGDGVNDKVFVRGFGIIKMTWRVYNRWGAVVFETNDRTQGWDGTYKGALQPKEVYHYILDVEYSDNTRFTKRGDITLLR
jgi:gliding motility-associated-like protein